MHVRGLPASCRWIVVLICLTAPGSGRGYAQTTDAAQVLAATRAALGGDERLAAVRTFIATGRTRQVRGENLVPIEFEIQVELPDKYSRRDEFPAQDSGPATSGFSGDQLIQIPRRSGQPEAALNARLAAIKQDFARLTLGMFAASFSSFPLAFDYVAQAEAPQGKADVIDVKGPANFAARLFVDSESRLPIMLSWQARAAVPPPGGSRPPDRAAAATTAVEHRLYFADYREVDGLRFPFRIRRAVGGETTEETTFDRFRLNARIDPRRFDTGN